MCYVVVMERVGIRDLKQHASAVIRRVSAGEEVEVTDRGRPVARIVPLPATDEYQRLIAAGELRVAEADWREVEPADPSPGATLSATLEEMRAEDDR